MAGINPLVQRLLDTVGTQASGPGARPQATAAPQIAVNPVYKPGTTTTPTAAPGYKADGSALKGYASSTLSKYGWTPDQMGALDTLWTHESGWNPNAQNPTSTAYGIAQFLDSTWGNYGKKTSNGNAQIDAGLKYIKARYGSPAAAWNFWAKNHWY